MKIKVLDELNRRLSDVGLLHRLGVVSISQVQRNILKGKFASNAPLTQRLKKNNFPLRDTETFFNSFGYQISDDTVQVGSTHPAAGILHDGGIIRPRRAKALAIPLNPKTKAFMRQYGATPRACISGMKADGYKIWTKKNVVLAQKDGGQIYGLFVLRKSVKIPARPYAKLPEFSMRVLQKVVRNRIFQ